jgi:hypothetical protein
VRGGFSRKGLNAHHKHAIANGGPDVESNIEVLCETCHSEWHRVEGMIRFETFIDTVPVWFSGWMRENWDGHDVRSTWMMFRWLRLGGSFEVKGSGVWWLPPSGDAQSLPRISSPPVSPGHVATTTPEERSASRRRGWETRRARKAAMKPKESKTGAILPL